MTPVGIGTVPTPRRERRTLRMNGHLQRAGGIRFGIDAEREALSVAPIGGRKDSGT